MSRPCSARRRWIRAKHLQYEALERRNLLATYIVQLNPATGTGGDGSPQNPFASISSAVAAAKLNPGPDEIQVRPGNYPESVSINDTAELRIVGDALQRPSIRNLTITTPNANFVIENLNVNSSNAAGVFVNNLPGPNSVIPSRTGSVTLNNMNITLPALSTDPQSVLVNGLNQFIANNVVSNAGRISLSDVNTASLSQITVNGARTDALAANYVTSLTVSGLIALQPSGTGVVLNNISRSTPGAVNAPSTVNLTGVHVSNSGTNGLQANFNTALTIQDSSFTRNTVRGLSLDSMSSVDLTNVTAIGNGISAQGFGVIATNTGSITITGGNFSNNSAAGIFADAISGSVRLTDVTANSNAQHGAFLRNMTGDVTLTRVSTNDNLFSGLIVTTSPNPLVPPKVSINDNTSLRNAQSGTTLSGVGQITINGLAANDNGGIGLQVASLTGTVAVANAQFNRNAQLSPVTNVFRSGAVFSTLKSGITLTNVTANNNALDGLIIDNAIGPIVASGVSASGNPLTGLYVNNNSRAQQATLTLADSNLSGNGKNGLLSVSQSKVTITGSHFDNNGPAADANVDVGTGAWISATGTGGVSIDDSTAIGTRLGVLSGAGIQIFGALGNVLIRRVNVSDTQVHPLMTANAGAGLVISTSSAGALSARIEDSTFNNNSLANAFFNRAVISSNFALSIIRSQLLDNRAFVVSGGQNVELIDSTIARTTGTAMSIASGSITRSTISGSTLLAVSSRGALSIEQSTLTENATVPSATSPTFVIQNTSGLSLRNSIVAGNGANSLTFSNAARVLSNGYNFLSGTPAGWAGQSSDIIGSVNNPIDPMLAPLANNGGPTLTHMPLPGSPVLETGDPTLNGSSDQRGVSIPQSLTASSGLPDIGSVEASALSNLPIIQINTRNVIGNEGSQLSVRGRVTDLDGNFSSLTASTGAIQVNPDGTFSWTLDTTDNFNLPVTLTATDATGGVGTLVFNAISNNVAPQLTVTPFINSANRTISLQSIANDPGSADTFTFVVNWGDGTTETFSNLSSSQLFSHNYVTAFPSTVVVSVTDDDGAAAAPVTLSINSAPTIQLDATSVVGDEGTQLRLTGRVVDLENNLATLVASTGSVQLNSDGTFVWTLSGVDDLQTSVQLVATDALGATDTKSFSAQVRNVAPVLGSTTLTPDWATRTITLQSSLTDVGLADTHVFTINWGDGTSTSISAGNTRSITTTHQYFSGSGPIIISISARDDDQGTSQTTTLAANVAPTLQLDQNSVSGLEGSPLTLTGRASDIDGNLASVSASIGLVQLNSDGTFTWSLTSADDLNTTVTLTATDVLGAAFSTIFEAVATNVAPSVGNAQATYNFVTNQVTLSFSFIDPGLNDSHVFTVDWGDGTTDQFSSTGSGRNIAALHQYVGFMPDNITVRVTDDEGASSATVTVPVNYPPTIELAAASVTGVEGSAVTLQGRVTDRNGNLATLTATLGTVQLNADGSFIWTYTSTDDLNTTTVGLLATDAGGANGVSEFTVRVSNVAPSITPPIINVDSATRSVTLQTSVVDPGTADTHSVTINWGDGTTSNITPNNLLVSAAHTYAAVGAITVTVSVTDDDGQSSSSSYVLNSAPTVSVNSSAVSGNEGSTLTLSGRVSDIDNNVTSLTASLGAVQVNADGTFTWSYTAPDEISSQQIVLTATDAFGATSQASFTLSVANVAPSLGAISTSVNIATNVLTLNTTVSDPGLLDTQQVTIQWGDGTSSVVTPSANGAVTATRVYASSGTKVITVRAADNDGASSPTVTVEQTIHGFVLRNRELTIFGTPTTDSITFIPQRGNDVLIVANLGAITSRYTFSTRSVDTVIGYLGAGNDSWNGASLDVSQFVFGESGNDRIVTGDANDILVGGDGSDYLSGEEGSDLIFGGLGADTLLGKDGGDILVAGRYQREAELTSLRLIRESWLASRSYLSRVNRIRTGVGFDSQGAAISLSINQVTDDAIDELFGGRNSDWYFTNLASEVKDSTREENIN